MRRLVPLLLTLACSPVREVGPTAVVLEVYFSEARGTKALIISGTAQVDGATVNVFPTSQRPEKLTGAAFPVPQTVRVLVNDSRGGQAMVVSVVGVDADGTPVEAATKNVVPVVKAETLVSITLRPFADGPDGGSTAMPDAGLTFDAGVGSGGCNCSTGCCAQGSGCAVPVAVQLASGVRLPLFPLGPARAACNSVCPLFRASQVVAGDCRCGTGPVCAQGQRCDGVGDTARCVCDSASGCVGCCSGTTCVTEKMNGCGNAGNVCDMCDTCSLNRVCAGTRCVLGARDTCCTGSRSVEAKFPTCAAVTGDCTPCDVLRSNQCRPTAIDGNRVPCGCGAGPPCIASQLCMLVNQTPTCVDPF